MLTPVGRPVALQAYGCTPPFAEKETTNEPPTFTVASSGAVTTTGSATPSVNCLVAVRLPSLARTVNVESDADVGVPAIAPLLSSVSPAGSEPAVTVQLDAVPPDVLSWNP